MADPATAERLEGARSRKSDVRNATTSRGEAKLVYRLDAPS